MANQVIVTANNTVQVSITPTPTVEVQISRAAINAVTNVANANYANFAGTVVNSSQPNITSVGTLGNLSVSNTITTGNLVVTGNLQVGNLVANSANYANFAGIAYSVDGANVTGTVANANYANIAGTAYSVNAANITGNIANANYAAFAGNVVTASQPNITSLGTLTGLAINGTVTGNIIPSANITYDLGNTTNRFKDLYLSGNTIYIGSQNITSNATSITLSGILAGDGGGLSNITGANVTGTVANATYALNAGNANYANIAGTAYSVSVGNVSGIGNIATVNLDGNSSNVLRGDGTFAPEGSSGNANYANFAGTAFSVSGSNVSGAVANATYANDAGNANIANTAYSVSGANVSGAVANATYANDAGNANFANTANISNIANTAYSVSVGNVSGIGNIATINLDGNASNILYGNGSFAPVPTVSNVANANYANFAGTAYNVSGSNVSGAVANAVYADNAGNANIANTAYSVSGANVVGEVAVANTVSNPNQSNITTVGTLGNLAVTGNITANVITANYINANISFANVDSIQFDTAANVTLANVGQIAWDDGDGTLQLLMKGGNVVQQIGTQEYARVYNAEATTLNKGEVVYVFGAQGNRLSVKRAQANAEATSFGTVGFVAESIASGSEGYIITSGALYKLNTLGLTAGSAVYLSPSVAGGYTTTKPVAPDQLVVLGWIERVNATVGSIYVKVDNGYELDELHDVLITSPVAGQALVYNSSNLWVNGNPNFANTAGTVTTNAQPNITSVGTLANLDVNGASNLSNITVSGSITFNNPNVSTTDISPLTDSSNNNTRTLTITGGQLTNASPTSTTAGTLFLIGGNAIQNDAGNAWIARGGGCQGSGGVGNTANGNAFGGAFIFAGGAGNTLNGNATGGALQLSSGLANSTNGSATTSNVNLISGTATASNGNSRSGNITIRTGAANSATSGTATIGNIIIETGAANGVTANVKGTIAIGNSGNANLITIGHANTPANINGILNVTGNVNGNIIVANYLYGDGSNISNVIASSANTANYANFAGDVVNASQANITSVGNLVSLQVGNNAANTVTTTFTPVGANITTLSGDIFVNNKRVSYDDVNQLANGVSTQDAIIMPNDTGNSLSQNYVVNYLVQDLANISNIATMGTETVGITTSYTAGDMAAPGQRIYSLYSADSQLANANPNTTVDITLGGTGMFINQKMPNQNNGPAQAGLIGTMNYGEVSNPASATGIVFQRRRGNNSGGTSTRLPLQGNDYLGNIVWRGAGTATGSINSQRAVIGAKVDSSYGGPGNAMPIGMEMVVVNSSNSQVTHSFYANGDVSFASAITANGTITATNIGNVANTNFNGNGSTVLLGNGVFGTAPAGTPTSIQNGNSVVDFTGSGGDLRINIDGRQYATFNYNRQLVLEGIEGDYANASQIKLDNGGIQVINEDLGGGLASFEFKSYYSGGTIAPYVFQRARGNLVAPANAQSGDAIMNQSFQAYSGSGFASAGSFSATVTNNDNAGNVRTRIELLTNNNNDSSEIKLNTDIVNVAANTSIFLNANNSNVSGNLNVASNVSVTGTANIANTNLNRFQETVYAYGNATGTITPDFNNGSIQNLTLTGNITLNSLGNAVAGRSMTLILTQDSNGSRLLSSTMKFAGASKTLTTTANAIDIISVFYDGATYYATLSKGYA